MALSHLSDLDACFAGHALIRAGFEELADPKALPDGDYMLGREDALLAPKALIYDVF